MREGVFVFTSSLRDFLRAPRWVVWGLIGVFVLAIALTWTYLSDQDAAQNYARLTEVIVFRVTALAAAVFATMVVSAEVEQKTIVYLLTRTVPRWKMALGRGLAACTAITIVSWMAVLGGGLGVHGGALFSQGAFYTDLMVTALGAFMYGGFFLLLSLLINKVLLWCLIFAFGWESFVPQMPGDLYLLSINTYMRALAGHAPPSPPAGEIERARAAAAQGLTAATVSPTVAWIVTIGIIVGTMALAVWVFSRAELVPREDGD